MSLDPKIKWDRGNPTGHGIIFIGGGDEVYCYLPPGGGCEEIQEGKARCPNAQEEEDEEGDAGEEENRDEETGAKARAHYARSGTAAGKFRRQD
jgi:hypothetical protein